MIRLLWGCNLHPGAGTKCLWAFKQHSLTLCSACYVIERLMSLHNASACCLKARSLSLSVDTLQGHGNGDGKVWLIESILVGGALAGQAREALSNQLRCLQRLAGLYQHGCSLHQRIKLLFVLPNIPEKHSRPFLRHLCEGPFPRLQRCGQLLLSLNRLGFPSVSPCVSLMCTSILVSRKAGHPALCAL